MYCLRFALTLQIMIQVKVKDAALREAAMQDMDSFLRVFIDATKEAIGGELNADNMQQLSVSQITLLAYDILHEEVMDGGFVQLIYNGYGGFTAQLLGRGVYGNVRAISRV